MIDTEIEICFQCGHNFSKHRISTYRKGQHKYKTSIKCLADIGEDHQCSCNAGFIDLNLTLTYSEIDTD